MLNGLGGGLSRLRCRRRRVLAKNCFKVRRLRGTEPGPQVSLFPESLWSTSDRKCPGVHPCVDLFPRERRRHAGERTGARTVCTRERLAENVLQEVYVHRPTRPRSDGPFNGCHFWVARCHDRRDDLTEQLP